MYLTLCQKSRPFSSYIFHIISLSATLLLTRNNFEIVGALLLHRILLRNLAPATTTVCSLFLGSANARGINDAFVGKFAATHKLFGEVTGLDGVG